ncbi:MAG: sporulation protein YlmC with PRC-barrel domain [Oceanicoccus sp.]|jgi:sporulation protein YlmC with PRC-barrel domain
MKKHWSQIAKLPVKVSDESVDLGRINGVFIHPDSGQVIGFLAGLLKVLVPVDVRKWTTQQVIITEEEALMPPMENYRIKDLGIRRAFFNSKRVKSKLGHYYGTIRDFQMDMTLNQLLTFEVSKRFLGIEWDKRQFEYRDIDHITDTRVILSVEPEASKKALNLRTSLTKS